MKRYVIMTGKGDAYVTFASGASEAVNAFHKKWPGLEVSSVFEATEF